MSRPADDLPPPFREFGWSLLFLLVGLLLVVYPILVYRNIGGWGGAVIALVTGGLGLLAGLVLLIAGGAGVVRVLRRFRGGRRS